jgi:hypothetical protein
MIQVKVLTQLRQLKADFGKMEGVRARKCAELRCRDPRMRV